MRVVPTGRSTRIVPTGTHYDVSTRIVPTGRGYTLGVGSAPEYGVKLRLRVRVGVDGTRVLYPSLQADVGGSYRG